MPLPKPQLGLVISYAYLWHHEHQTGQEEGLKDRPCVIVLAVDRGDEVTMVTVVPITHSAPTDANLAIELPPAVKRHLGLDAERSWVMLHEGNRFAWPGYDLRPVSRALDRYDYGLLPPRLFISLVERFMSIWKSGKGRAVSRD